MLTVGSCLPGLVSTAAATSGIWLASPEGGAPGPGSGRVGTVSFGSALGAPSTFVVGLRGIGGSAVSGFVPTDGREGNVFALAGGGVFGSCGKVPCVGNAEGGIGTAPGVGSVLPTDGKEG